MPVLRIDLDPADKPSSNYIDRNLSCLSGEFDPPSSHARSFYFGAMTCYTLMKFMESEKFQWGEHLQ